MLPEVVMRVGIDDHLRCDAHRLVGSVLMTEEEERRVDRLLAAQTDLLRSLDEARGSEVRQELNGIEQVGLAHRVRARNARVRTKIDDDPEQILESVDLQTRELASSLSHHTDALPGHVSASAPAVHSYR